MWKKYIVFVKTTLGVAFHHLDPTFINAYIVKLLQAAVVSHGVVRSAASSCAAMRMVAGSHPVLVIT